jgi:ATP-dependent Clp protease adapter protein ClpS
MIAQELEVILHQAFVGARAAGHEYITVEHLLLAVLKSTAVAAIVERCGADAKELRSSLSRHIGQMDRPIVDGQEIDTQPALAFQRVIQRAILNVQAAGTQEVGSVDVLAAIIPEPKSYAAQLLKQHSVTWQKATSRITPQPVNPAAATEVQVVIYNDDFTPMEFVVRVLRELFGMGEDDAKETMLEIHREGAAVCGLYACDDGLALVEQVLALSQEHGHPLMCEAVVPKQAG